MDRAVEMLQFVGHPRCQATGQGVPAPAVGRHAPARDDRDGPLDQSGPAHRRRADDRARRHHPGADPRAHEGDADPERDGHHADHPRPRRRGRDGPRRRRHVCRQDRRAGRRGDRVRAARTTRTRRACSRRSRASASGAPGSRSSRAPSRTRSTCRSGCLFKRRCPYAMPICDTAPPFQQVEPGHFSRCWLTPTGEPPAVGAAAPPGRRRGRGRTADGRGHRSRGCRPSPRRRVS